MERRTARLDIRLTAREHDVLKRKAEKAGMSVSKFMRMSLIHSDEVTVRTIDTGPLRDLCFEFTKQGTNLNQFMRFLNTYGVDGFDPSAAKRLISDGGEMVRRIGDALASMEREAEENGIHIIHAPDDDGDEIG